MKVQILCKRYYTNKDLFEDRFGRLYHLPVQLSANGVNANVLALDYRSRTTARLEMEGVVFESEPASITRLPGLFRKLIRASRDTSPDVLIASGDSHIGYIGWHIAKRIDAKFVFDVYDYYPAFKGNRLPGMKSLFRIAAAKADLVLCASVPLQRGVVGLNPRTLIVENGVDRSVFFPRQMAAARSALGLQGDEPVVGYFGTITSTRGPLLFEACRLVRKSFPALRLLVAGRAMVPMPTDPWITYLGEVPQTRIPDLIAACDVVTVPYANDAFNSMAGACKIAEYLACGRPVVATRVSSHAAYFGDAPGALCEPDAADMARALSIQFSSPKMSAFPRDLEWGAIGRKTQLALEALCQ